MKILEVHFKTHNPTTLNAQGADEGTQYRSTIMYHNELQKSQALRSIEEHQKLFKNPIVTEVVPAPRFWPAEKFHQDYYNKNPNDGYSQYNIPPKLEKVRDMPEF